MISNIRKITKQLWGAIVAGGLLSIIFGLATMLWPHAILSIFIYLFGIFVLVVSVVVLGRIFSNIGNDRLWWLSMLFAICGISLGLFVIVNPGVAQAFLAVLLAIYIFTQSLIDLVVASYSDDTRTRTPMIITGIVGVIFGFLVLFQPQLSTEALVWVIGLYILVHGIVTEYYAIRVRRSVKNLGKALRDTFDDLTDDIPEAEVVKSSRKSRKSASKKSTAAHTKRTSAKSRTSKRD